MKRAALCTLSLSNCSAGQRGGGKARLGLSFSQAFSGGPGLLSALQPPRCLCAPRSWDANPCARVRWGEGKGVGQANAQGFSFQGTFLLCSSSSSPPSWATSALSHWGTQPGARECADRRRPPLGQGERPQRASILAGKFPAPCSASSFIQTPYVFTECLPV